MELYVSKKGKDTNSGEKNSPLATVKAALEKVRNDKGVIYIEEGRYCFDDTVLLDESNIKICALGEVIFDGGILLDKDNVKDYNDKIKYIDLKPYNIILGEYGNRGFRRSYINAPNELFINNKPYTVARYPKNGTVKYTSEDIIDCGSRPEQREYDMRCPTVRLNDERIANWKNAKDAYLGGFPNYSWADDCLRITDIDIEQRTVKLNEPHLFAFAATGHSSWYIVNLFEELSEPGEYYIDREEEKLYFIPEGEIEQIQISVLDKVMFACENVSNVTFEGIIFENSRNSAIYIEGGENVHIKNCTFRNLGIMAVQMGQGAEPQPHGKNNCHGSRDTDVEIPKPISREMGSWHEYLYEFAAWDNNAGANHLIENCKIYNTGAGGILLSGGNRKTLVPGNNTVYNCEFHDCNRLDKTYKSAVNIMGVGNRVANCEIYNLPGMAIYLHGNDHIIEYNKIHHVLQSVSDSGAIYMGRDMSEVGNVIRHNFIYSIHNPHKTDLGVCAVYFDDWSVYNMVYANCFYDIVSDGKFFFSTVYHTCGGLTSIGNNLLVDCFPGFNPNTKSNANLRMHTNKLAITRVHTTDENDIHGVDVTSDIYKEKYPYLYKTYTEDYNPGTKYWHNRVYVNQYDDFADAKNLNFELKDDAEHLQSNMPEYKITDDVFGLKNETVDIINIDFDNIGLKNV